MSNDHTGLQSGSPQPSREELSLLGARAVQHERADAARNRLKVLDAAERLFRERGVPNVSMDDVAQEAGVGKGTLYRRFGDKSGLAQALLGERERELQEAMIEGPPPLGPGAHPSERLVAFITTYAKFVVTHLDLVLMSETATPGARPRIGANQLWRLHCRLLLEAAGVPDPHVRADALVAAVSAEQIDFWISTDEAAHGPRQLPDWLAGGLARMCQSLTVAGTE